MGATAAAVAATAISTEARVAAEAAAATEAEERGEHAWERTAQLMARIDELEVEVRAEAARRLEAEEAAAALRAAASTGLLAAVDELVVRTQVSLLACAREPPAHAAAEARLHEHDSPVAPRRLFALLLLLKLAQLTPSFGLLDNAVPMLAHHALAPPLDRHRGLGFQGDTRRVVAASPPSGPRGSSRGTLAVRRTAAASTTLQW